jgi:hypothetical protein
MQFFQSLNSRYSTFANIMINRDVLIEDIVVAQSKALNWTPITPIKVETEINANAATTKRQTPLPRRVKGRPGPKRFSDEEWARKTPEEKKIIRKQHAEIRAEMRRNEQHIGGLMNEIIETSDPPADQNDGSVST